MVMESVSVANLKSGLSAYLSAVKKGKQITVTSHGNPIARLGPLEEHRSDLEIIPARKPMASLKKIKGIKLAVDPVAYLLEDRRRR